MKQLYLQEGEILMEKARRFWFYMIKPTAIRTNVKLCVMHGTLWEDT